ncbi:flagellar basal body P-ring formation chaperone FlgA [Sulfurospirillum sp. 1612]|uniref:flagellar basal body P-ring formation chaperone FlgA n=1 Tax=Sulfurospirillum sp. 1612 TaxID=3094835 RepID=UPI002F94843F
MTIRASFFLKNPHHDFTILKIPKNLSSFSVPSLQIVSKLKEHNMTYSDHSGGIITFRKCYEPVALQAIKTEIRKKFQRRYPSMNIQKIKLQAATLPNFDLSKFTLSTLNLKENNYRNATGTLSVTYTKKFQTKKIYLKYHIIANISVFKAKYNLRNGKILQNNDYQKTVIPFDVLPRYAITGKMHQEYIIRGYIKKGAILTRNDLKIKKLLLKNDLIQAVLQDENLRIATDAHVLSDANIGDVVKIRTAKGKVFRAKILSQKSAMILE